VAPQRSWQRIAAFALAEVARNRGNLPAAPGDGLGSGTIAITGRFIAPGGLPIPANESQLDGTTQPTLRARAVAHILLDKGGMSHPQGQTAKLHWRQLDANKRI
jgi:hypothetical protein